MTKVSSRLAVSTGRSQIQSPWQSSPGSFAVIKGRVTIPGRCPRLSLLSIEGKETAYALPSVHAAYRFGEEAGDGDYLDPASEVHALALDGVRHQQLDKRARLDPGDRSLTERRVCDHGVNRDRAAFGKSFRG